MMPLSSWLSCSWRHTKGDGYGVVVEAAQKLDALVWDLHGFKLLFVDDPWRFRDISTDEVKRAQREDMGLGDAEYPQLGMHADPTCRALDSSNFFALIGTRTDRPLPLITMNSAALYDRHGHRTTLTGLFVSRRLWSDNPDRDCIDLDVEFTTHEDTPWNDLPAVFLGTAWVTPLRRKQGIMELVSELHRLVAYIRWGALPQFATIVPDRNHDKLFKGRAIGAVIEKWPTHATESRVLFYDPADLLSSAMAVLNPTPILSAETT